MPIWNPEYESMDREALAKLQLRRLQSTVAWVYERVPYYKEVLDASGVKPKDIRSLADVRLLPFTDKTALRDTYPYGMFAVDLEQVVRVHSSSGTTGKPIVVGYTKGDLNTWTELTARIASAAGVTSKDRVQLAFLYGMFTGGWGMHYGIERVGATVFPAGSGNTERQLLMMQDFGTTVLVCTPSYALYIAEVAEKSGIDIKSLPLRVGLFGGEPSGEGMREEIEKRLGILATDNYGLSEVMGPGVSGECEYQCGLHMNEDHFLFEVVDPQTGEPVLEGEEGELIITPLTKEAFPVLRYRTHDLTTIDTTVCECGRTMARMRKVRARTDDMLIIRGVNVFPSQIEDVLVAIEGIEPHYLIIVDRKGSMDDLEVQIEVAEEIFSDVMADMVAFIKLVTERLFSVIGLHAKVRLVEPGTIERTAGKARRVIDKRQTD
ncbi:MAG: phenylacetate--CoA ligase [Coriobacteriia bacterium]|nr:phenylacetate--CoA ligase [Coriobacteriia bacterium]